MLTVGHQLSRFEETKTTMETFIGRAPVAYAAENPALPAHEQDDPVGDSAERFVETVCFAFLGFALEGRRLSQDRFVVAAGAGGARRGGGARRANLAGRSQALGDAPLCDAGLATRGYIAMAKCTTTHG